MVGELGEWGRGGQEGLLRVEREGLMMIGMQRVIKMKRTANHRLVHQVLYKYRTGLIQYIFRMVEQSF